MLVLSTELESGIRIGDNITIKVLDVRTRHVRLGINAPRSVAIEREANEHAAGPAIASKSNGDDLPAVAGLNAIVISADDACRANWQQAMLDAGFVPNRILTLAGSDHSVEVILAPGLTRDLGLIVVDLASERDGGVSLLTRLRNATGGRLVSILALLDERAVADREALLQAGATHLIARGSRAAFRRKAVRSASWLAAASRDAD